ncbi:MAG: c-type cytochrome [Planctomycetia bacterium]|nr:c-type cytochrome [Planctomycetia bacterium]
MSDNVAQVVARLVFSVSLAIFVFDGGAAAAQSSSSSVAPLLRLLQSGKLPAARKGTVVEMICSRGEPDDLAVVLKQTIAGDYDAALSTKVLQLLTDAAVVRKVKPAGDLSVVEKLLQPAAGEQSDEVRLAAVRLAGIWKVASAADELRAIVADETLKEALRNAAVDGLGGLGGDEAQRALGEVSATAKSASLRFRAAAALAKLDLNQAADVAAKALAAASPTDDVGPLLDAFLTRKGGPDKLAAALKPAGLTPDAAKLSLRYIYSVGRSDPELSNVLSSAAGIALDQKPPTPEELQALLKEIAEHGDAARGERIFRRTDLSCMKCHAVSRAGGQVGPDLSAIGSISPVDYVANSILVPNLAIKEQFVTRVFTTADGQTITGIVVDRDDVRVNVKDAGGKVVTIPTADIDEEEEGKSLMPQGLTKFLTRQELVDLVKFISELGRPGPYAIRSLPTIQRWRVLKSLPTELQAEAPNVEHFREHVLDAPADAWAPAYGMTAGVLPLAELGKPGSVLFLQGELEVVEPGSVTFRVDSTEPTLLWIDAEPFESQSKPTIELTKGRHRVTLRIALGSGSESPQLKVEISKPANSKAQFDVVGGS